jgi:hypothetical protein
LARLARNMAVDRGCLSDKLGGLSELVKRRAEAALAEARAARHEKFALSAMTRHWGTSASWQEGQRSSSLDAAWDQAFRKASQERSAESVWPHVEARRLTVYRSTGPSRHCFYKTLAARLFYVARLKWPVFRGSHRRHTIKCKALVRPAGIEPATLGFGGQYSIH